MQLKTYYLKSDKNQSMRIAIHNSEKIGFKDSCVSLREMKETILNLMVKK